MRRGTYHPVNFHSSGKNTIHVFFFSENRYAHGSLPDTFASPERKVDMGFTGSKQQNMWVECAC